MARPICPLALDSDQIKHLKTVIGRRSSPQRTAMRANIVWFRSLGLSQQEVASRLMVERVVVSKWENRFRREGLAGLEERPRSGRPPQVEPATKAAILDQAVRPPNHLKRWSTRTTHLLEMRETRTLQRLRKQLEQLEQLDLLILDEIGYVPFSK